MSTEFARWFVSGFTATGASLAALAFGGAWLLVPPPLERFATAAYSFEIARGWSCIREGTEFVCRRGQPPSDSIIIMTAKYRGPEDTMSMYEDHLRGPIPAVGREGNAELLSLKRVNLSGAEWVEGVLRDSEVAGYETTYLAALTAEVAMLVTFSIHEKFKTQRLLELRAMMDTLVIYQASARR
jgi:hypothetical protein